MYMYMYIHIGQIPRDGLTTETYFFQILFLHVVPYILRGKLCRHIHFSQYCGVYVINQSHYVYIEAA